MKKICRKIRLRKFKCNVNEKSIKEFEGTNFYVLFSDGTYRPFNSKYDLLNILEQDHIKKVHCIFDMVDKILIDREVLIDTDRMIDYDR